MKSKQNIKRKHKPVYFVVAMFFNRNKTIKRRCTWGFFYSRKIAIRSVSENWLDMFEDGFYNYAVVEKATEGFIGGIDRDMQWFKYDKDINNNVRICKCDCPKQLDRCVHFW